MSDEKERTGIKRLISKFKRKELGREQYFIILLFGILLLVAALPVNSHKTSSSENEESHLGKTESDVEKTQITEKKCEWDDEYTDRMEKQLGEILRRVNGVGETEVMITLKYMEELVVAKDLEIQNDQTEETDSDGGKKSSVQSVRREETVYSQEDETPFVIKQSLPEVEGVLVICEGGDNSRLIADITEAVHALTGVEVHKIRVMKMK